MRALIRKYGRLPNKHLMVAEGEVYKKPCLVNTVLGSCVAVTFFCPRKKIGGLFHSLLPVWSQYEPTMINSCRFRYVDSAIEALLGRFKRLEIKTSGLECKVFGGASAMFPEEMGVGNKNVQTAFEQLAANHLRVTASNVGGERGRKLVFVPHTGEVYVKYIEPSHNRKS